MSNSTDEADLARSRKKDYQLGQTPPRNPGEQLYFDRFGTVTPIPEKTMTRKNSIQLTAILYIHQGVHLKDACRLTDTDHAYGERIRKKDRWDEFHQELAQMTKPSNLTLVKSHDFDTVSKEHARRVKTLPALEKKEADLVAALELSEAGTQQESILINSLTKVRTLIGEVTGYTEYRKEMSSARQAGLSAAAKEAPNSAGGQKQTKGSVIDIS